MTIPKDDVDLPELTPSTQTNHSSTKPLDDPLLSATLGITLFAAGYGMFLFLALDYQELNAALEKTFGPKWFGLGTRIVFVILVSILLLPLCFACYHAMAMGIGVTRRGGHMGRGIRLFVNAFHCTKNEPKLRRSLWISIAGLMYFLLLALGWIALTNYIRL
ncbi:MAG: hypothetical protein ACOYKN_06150 [Pirellula sp.]|jgi:hypothetical protein